ncbi:MAG: hypothetical protein ACK4MM_03385 [Fervidobacterium sp.]
MNSKKVKTLHRGYRQENNRGKIVFAVIMTILFVVIMYFGIRIFAIRNSEEFNMDKLSVYYVYESESANTSNITDDYINYKIIVVDGQKRVVHIIDIPSKLYVFSKRLSISDTEPYKIPIIFSELLELKSSYNYTILLKKDYLKKTGVKDIETFVQEYSKRGLSIVDYFTIRSQLEALRPESVITEASLAKLYNALGKFNIRKHVIPTITKSPMKITVGDKVYVRIYADEEKFEQLRKNLSE